MIQFGSFYRKTNYVMQVRNEALNNSVIVLMALRIISSAILLYVFEWPNLEGSELWHV